MHFQKTPVTLAVCRLITHSAWRSLRDMEDPYATGLLCYLN